MMAASWLQRLRQGLSRTSQSIRRSWNAAFASSDQAQRQQTIEDALLMADLGVDASQELAQLALKASSSELAHQAVYERIVQILDPCARGAALQPAGSGLQVVIMTGVNGSGKTTTCGKLARQWQNQGYRVALVAADIFRAAAQDQIKVWSERVPCPLLGLVDKSASLQNRKMDVASVVFDSLAQAKAMEVDIAIVDTAGRLQSYAGLLDELAKVARICAKHVPQESHRQHVLVLDGTVGQNALAQVREFGKAVDITGLIVNKLDGTAKGGIVVALAREFGLPIHAVGVGEKIDDMQPFTAQSFTQSLLGEVGEVGEASQKQ